MSNRKLQKSGNLVVSSLKLQEGIAQIVNMIVTLGHLDVIMTWINASALAAGLVENENNRRQILKAMLFTRDANGMDKLAELAGLFNQLMQDCGQVDLSIATMTYDRLKPLMSAYSNAMGNIRDNKDHGEALRDLARIDDATIVISEMQAIVRSGRPPQPSTRLLRSMVQKYKGEYGTMWAKMALRIVDDLSKIPAGARTQVEIEALNTLKGMTSTQQSDHLRHL